MPNSPRTAVTPASVLCVIMGGGQGTRLFPLTRERSKPAVPLAGKYRLVDIPISNCINSGFKQIYLLTQFNSASLHRHISQSYKFDHFTGGFVEILAAEQTYTDNTWYQGTADAVRKNLVHLLNRDFDYLVILSGDQLYRMDLQQIVGEHLDNNAEVTIATIPVDREAATSLGIMRIDARGKIVQFEEKPKDPAVLNTLNIDAATRGNLGIAGEKEAYLASMGIYVFNRDVLIRLLDNTQTDFGKHIIPGAIHSNEVYAHIFQGYWEDIGTIRSFFEANLDVTLELPRFNFFDMSSPIFTRPRFLPASKVNGAEVDHGVISDGCIVSQAKISHSLVGIRSVLAPGAQLHRTVLMGSDYYESQESIAKNEAEGRPRIGIGRNTRIDNAIIDKNCRIGDNCLLSPTGKPEHLDHALYYIRDGVLCIPKGGYIPHNMVI
jgi:glucose-1-phosphate adenylyltransferase